MGSQVRYGLSINTDGSVTSFSAEGLITFPGILTWERGTDPTDSTHFVLRQELGDIFRIFAGRIKNDSTLITGAWIEWDGLSIGTSGMFGMFKL